MLHVNNVNIKNLNQCSIDDEQVFEANIRPINKKNMCLYISEVKSIPTIILVLWLTRQRHPLPHHILHTCPQQLLL